MKLIPIRANTSKSRSTIPTQSGSTVPRIITASREWWLLSTRMDNVHCFKFVMLTFCSHHRPSGSKKSLKEFKSAASSASADVAPNRGVTGGMVVSSNKHSSSSMEYASTPSSMSSTSMIGTSAASATTSYMVSTMTSGMTPVATSSANVPVITGAASAFAADKKQGVFFGLFAAGCSWFLF